MTDKPRIQRKFFQEHVYLVARTRDGGINCGIKKLENDWYLWNGTRLEVPQGVKPTPEQVLTQARNTYGSTYEFELRTLAL